ncbi:MAG TPA: penicillin-binding protein activator [Candidatus Fermentibacter daniensis]|mgnify:CR=1 FL=1|nr:MAG: hypothetical protein AO396_06775 [Candidatus Fermentibacter daniensis]MBP7720452.1 penicillin-binding protein activator [Candidatus Fermentibacter sp.]KZD15623.1 MAG: hypothetical protein AO395_05700 [Candidatus Fermentibacter daniensis]KZD18425.1 MAG: hypothetical protein AO394_03050 [Candidatus Fermentibacter daniensis]MCC6872579.1 penicillin-binding protein activator [Candidatus Fermentibacter sp.]
MPRRALLVTATFAVLMLMASCRIADSGDGAAQAEQARACLESGRWERAADLFTQAISAGPDNPSVPEWRLGRAEAWLGSGMVERALATADSIAVETRSGTRARALLLVARSLSALGRWTRAADALGSLNPENLRAAEAEAASALAFEVLGGLSADQLAARRRADWLEPYVLLELARRYTTSGETVRASMTAGELDRLYPGFRERYWAGGIPEGPERGYVALVLPMTGNGAAYASQVESGVRLCFERAADLVSNAPELVVVDTRGDREVLAAAGRNLGSDPGCFAVIGPLTSAETEAFAEYAQQYGLPTLSPAATSSDVDRIGAYVHRLVPAGADEAVTVAEYAVRTAGCSRLAILHSYTGTSVAQAEQFAATVERMGGRIVRTEAFATDDTDFKTQISSIKNASPDGIFIPVTAYEAVQIAPQLRYYSLNAMIFGTSGLDSEAVLRLGGEYMDGAVFTCSFGAGSMYPPTSSFVFHYRRKYGTDPSILSAQGYDAASVILDAASDGANSREAFERAITSTGSIRGASGVCTIGARTVARVSLPLVMVIDGEIVSVE